MKLLSAGKSMVGIREGHTKYKVTKANLVPHFSESGQPAKLAKHGHTGEGRKAEAEKNPFKSANQKQTQLLLETPERAEEAEKTDKPGEPMFSVETVVNREGPAAADAPAAAETLTGQAEAEATVKPVAEPAAKAKPHARQPKSSGAVRDAAARKREPEVTVVERKRKPKSAALVRLAALAKGPRRKTPSKPGEFWLKRLKVVRNDLSDADLEVVPAKGAKAGAARQPATPKPQAPRGAVARFVKSRKLARLVSACFAWF
ncbi:MAG: hypothetical protein HY300_17080 [Verrucomicrobia bacterium]|nr:hypothetical protein [Verrucomicrobiota bacterium]